MENKNRIPKVELPQGVIFNAYPDSIGQKLVDTADMLKRPEFEDLFSLFYILPTIFNSDLDRGFSVIDYRLVNPDLGKWANGDPYYVGDWNGYVAKCNAEGLIHSGGMHGWDISGITVVVFRKPFLPIGGGREDFFTIDKTKKMYHVRGLVGR